MKFRMYSIFDSAAASFLPPWTIPTEAMALRHLGSLPQSQPGHDFVKYSEHYTLFFLGEFDADTGILSQKAPEAVSNLKALFARVKVAEPADALERLQADTGYPERPNGAALREHVEARDHE